MTVLNKSRGVLRGAGAAFLFSVLFILGSAWPGTAEPDRPGYPADPDDINVYRSAGAGPGPVLMVVAGLHGDEPSGTAAARRVISGPPPARGSIVAIPAAAPEALAEGKRWAAGRSDLNRAFPVAAGKGRDRGADTSQSPCVFQDPTFDRAEALLNLIALERPALVLDLHESSRYWTEGDKPALVVPRSLEAAEIALRLLESTWLAGFSFTGPPPAGSLAAAADGILGIPALIVEVPGAMDADERIAVHLRVIRAALEILGMAPGRDTPVKSGRRE